jgi:lipoprotein-anchoring transpeptidase ErfK/SrfK
MKTSDLISRREFLKILGVGLGVLGIPEEFGSMFGDYSLFARVLAPDTPVFDEPSADSSMSVYYWQDAVLPVEETDGPWYRLVDGGYIPAEWVQPIRPILQQPDEGISRQGSLAEVSMPFANVYLRPSVTGEHLYRYYFGSTHWVNKLVYDRYGRGWYRIEDDKFPEVERWVLASRLRIIPPEELAPLSPDVPPEEKYLLVNLADQMVTAYESGQIVFEAVMSSGDQAANSKYQTPRGIFRVGFKRPSQHMLPWDQTFGDYDLPGVPWICYFTLQAHAFHGAYWHNGFGTPRSHGCVNLRPEDARWIYRWTTPVIQPHDDMEASPDGGTLVEVV